MRSRELEVELTAQGYTASEQESWDLNQHELAFLGAEAEPEGTGAKG